METKNTLTLPAIIIAIALVVAAICLTTGLFSIQNEQRTVTVRGLAEHEYDADFAVWPLAFSVSGNDLLDVQQEVTAKLQIVHAYLAKYGFTESEITVKEPSVTDAAANIYSQNEARFRYISESTVFVRSSNVAAVRKALSNSLDLIGDGIALKSDYDSRVSYLFTKLNTVKPQMIAEATQNAREAAEQFARDSGSKVGKIQSATQGFFSIEDASPGLPQKKTVRVVTTVEYLLKD